MDELKIEIFGRVQGVGFRHFVKEKADKLSLQGYVANQDDGSVVVIVQGSKEKLRKFLRVLQGGSVFSNVDGISYFWKGVEGKYPGFLIALDKGMIEDQKRNFINLGKNVLNLKGKIPRHVVIIPDGNRRWAKKRGLKITEGHKKAATFKRALKIFEEAERLGVQYLTLWVFSTDNWNRDSDEIEKLFQIALKGIKRFGSEFVKRKIRFRHLGRKDRLPKELVKELIGLEEKTKKFNNLCVQACIDYGGKDEIVRAVNKILKSGVKEIKENDISMHLDSSDIPDPDLIIRTSGEKRISGFMPIQSEYAELYFTDVYFPDFGPENLRKAVEEFGRRKRRFGK